MPVANYNGAPDSLSVRLADSSQLISTSSEISLALGGTNTWSAASILISTSVSPVNDAPVIANAGSVQGDVENAAGTVLEPALTLANADDTQLNQAIISISGFVAGDRLNLTNQAGITGSYNAVTSVLTLTGIATSASYQAALRTITFNSTSDNPGSGSLTIAWTVHDVNSEAASNGQQTSNVANTTVNVTPVNDAPSITGLDVTSTSTSVEKDPAVQIESNALLADPELDASTWNGAPLTLARQGGANAEDVFSGVAGLSLYGGNFVQGGIEVGSFTQAGGTLVFTFNAGATAARVDSVIQDLAYSNSSATPPSSITISYSPDDQNSNIAGGGTAGTGSNQGNGGKLLDSGKIIIDITPVNDAPVNTVMVPQITSEDSNLSITGLSVADVDNTILPTTISLPAGSGTLTVKPGSGAFVSFDGTGSVAIFGTAAQINPALNSVTFTP